MGQSHTLTTRQDSTFQRIRSGTEYSSPPVVLPETQGKVYLDRNKLLRRSSSGRSCTISGVPGWMQPEAGSICTAGTEVPFCRRYVVRCTVNLVNPRSGSVRTGVNEINSQVFKKKSDNSLPAGMIAAYQEMSGENLTEIKK